MTYVRAALRSQRRRAVPVNDADPPPLVVSGIARHDCTVNSNMESRRCE